MGGGPIVGSKGGKVVGGKGGKVGKPSGVVSIPGVVSGGPSVVESVFAGSLVVVEAVDGIVTGVGITVGTVGGLGG